METREYSKAVELVSLTYAAEKPTTTLFQDGR